MSNPTELPDVDYHKDMDRHYIPLPGGWEIQTKGKGSTFRIAHAGSGRRWMVLDDQLHAPLVVLANAVREALARRAQPEGEAPQAVDGVRWDLFPGYLIDHCEGDLLSEEGLQSALAGMLKDSQYLATVARSTPAAQHAESGTPAPADGRVDAIVTGLYRRFKDWSKREFSADDVTWCEVKADVIALIASGGAAIAAQSQGAQTAYEELLQAARDLRGELVVANALIERRTRERDEALAAQQAAEPGAEGKYAARAGDPDLDAACWAEVFYRNAETFTVRDLGIVRAAWKEATLRAALAAKAEAPAPEVPDVYRKVLSMPEGPGVIGPSAQQAAAPGSLDLMNADEMAALRRFDETCQDGEGYDVPKTMMQRLAAIGVVRRTSGSYYETTEFGLRVLDQPAPSAPGTPEAPADILLDAQRWRAFLGSARIRPLGSAGLNEPMPNNYAHMGLEIWTTGDWSDCSPALAKRLAYDQKVGIDWLTKYADIARAAQLDGGQGEGK